MPIDPSMSMSEIISKEMKHGKPQKQAIAIAYSVKGKSRKKRNPAIEGAYRDAVEKIRKEKHD